MNLLNVEDPTRNSGEVGPRESSTVGYLLGPSGQKALGQAAATPSFLVDTSFLALLMFLQHMLYGGCTLQAFVG